VEGWTGPEERVLRILVDLGVEHEVLPCDPALADTAAFCAAYGYDEADAANTLIIRSRGTPARLAACVLLATTRLDMSGTVRHRMGRKTSLAGADDTVALTGMALGGITPVGLPEGLPTWIDRRVLTRRRVLLGSGGRHAKIVAAPGFLARLPGAEVVDGLATTGEERHRPLTDQRIGEPNLSAPGHTPETNGFGGDTETA